jgi:hypothetical protein
MTESRPTFPSGSLNAEPTRSKLLARGSGRRKPSHSSTRRLQILPRRAFRRPSRGRAMPLRALPSRIRGRLVHSQELLAKGPLVLVFYRGMW